MVEQLNEVEAPTLDDDQLARLRAWGVQQDVAVGDILYRAGDREYDLILIDSGRVELVREATNDSPAEIVVEHGPGRFLGELNLLTRQTVYLTARVAEAGGIHRVAPERFRRLMAEDPDLSAILLRAFWARRQRLRESGAQRSLEIVGTDYSAACMALRTYAAGVWRDIRDSLREDALSADSVLKSWLREMIEAATQALLRNDGLRGRLNNWMHEVAVEVVQSHQHDVGVLIADTVRGWDTETVTARIERQVGEDLQYIRINGTLIGGLVGLVIYAVSRAFG